MDQTIENELLKLARKLKELDKRIIKGMIEGEEWSEWVEHRVQFSDTYRQIKEILGNASPLQIRDPEVRDTLKKVREGKGFYMDKDRQLYRQFFLKTRESVKRAEGVDPEQREDVLRNLEKIAPFFGIWEFDYDDPQFMIDVEEEIRFRIPVEEWLERKNEFSTIIGSTRLPDRVDPYFWEIRECFLFGQMRAVVGLCRVLIEVAFRDKFNKFGLGTKSKSQNVCDICDYRPSEIIRAVCNALRSKSLERDAKRLYHISSDVLHARENLSEQWSEREVLDFVRRTFKLIECLYDQ